MGWKKYIRHGFTFKIFFKFSLWNTFVEFKTVSISILIHSWSSFIYFSTLETFCERNLLNKKFKFVFLKKLKRKKESLFFLLSCLPEANEFSINSNLQKLFNWIIEWMNEWMKEWNRIVKRKLSGLVCVWLMVMCELIDLVRKFKNKKLWKKKKSRKKSNRFIINHNPILRYHH